MARTIPPRAPAHPPAAAGDRHRPRTSRRGRSAFLRALEGLSRPEAGADHGPIPLEAKGEAHLERPQPDPNPERESDGDERAALAEDDDASALAAFSPPPPVLGEGSFGAHLAPLSSQSVTPTDPTAQALAELAAMADSMVTSVSIGRQGADGHALRMKLDLGARGAVDVRLSLLEDDLEVALSPESLTHAEAASLAATVERELGVRVSLD